LSAYSLSTGGKNDRKGLAIKPLERANTAKKGRRYTTSEQRGTQG